MAEGDPNNFPGVFVGHSLYVLMEKEEGSVWLFQPPHHYDHPKRRKYI